MCPTEYSNVLWDVTQFCWVNSPLTFWSKLPVDYWGLFAQRHSTTSQKIWIFSNTTHDDQICEVLFKSSEISIFIGASCRPEGHGWVIFDRVTQSANLLDMFVQDFAINQHVNLEWQIWRISMLNFTLNLVVGIGFQNVCSISNSICWWRCQHFNDFVS